MCTLWQHATRRVGQVEVGMEKKDWTLMVLAAANGAALMPVQLQKALFLLGKRLPDVVGDRFYAFRPYHYGPFDRRVYQDAQQLAGDGLAVVMTGYYVSYAATPSGVARAQQLAGQNPRAWEYIKALVAWVRRQSFQSLVKSVYAEFPEMRSASIFRD